MPMLNTPATVRAAHYVLVPRDPRGRVTSGICGEFVRLADAPPQDSPRCVRCEAALGQVERAREYAVERKISPRAAGRALGFSEYVCAELDS
jgi:ribosomal protein L34E